MDRERRRIGSIKDKIDDSSSLKNPQSDIPEEPNSQAKELHRVRRDIGRFSDSQRTAETVIALAEPELFRAKKTVRNLGSRIERSNSETMSREVDNGRIDNRRYAEVARELECIKQELSRLKLDMASVWEAKREAEMETRASSSRIRSYSSSVEALRKEIEEANEEQVLVELARIEAVKEFGEIEACRKEDGDRYSSAMDETRRKMNGLVKELGKAKELEMELDVATSDVNMLKNELDIVRGLDKGFGGKDSPASLQSVTEELEAAEKELASVRDERFQLMASMDVVRNELKHITEETARLEKEDEKTDLTFQNLNWKLLRAKSKLESASAAEEKAKYIVSSLALSLEEIKSEAKAAKKEEQLIIADAANINAEVQKTESEMDLAEERLHAAMEELEAVKSSEASALERLKALIDDTMRVRALASRDNSTITISAFEYDYLRGRAVAGEEIADKKVAAAHAWIKALEAGEKEIIVKMEIANREIRELRVEEERAASNTKRQLSEKRVVELGLEEEQAAYTTKRQLSDKRATEGELNRWNSKPEGPMMPRKSGNRSGNLLPVRRAKNRRSVSLSSQQLPRVAPFAVKKKGKVMPNLGKLFNGKRVERGDLQDL